MEKIIFDIPMEKFLQQYFEKRLMYDISIGIYPHSNSFHNSSNVLQWIVDLQSYNLKKYVFSQSIYQSNDKIVHFRVVITDSREIEHGFNIRLDVQQMIRKFKLNKIKKTLTTTLKNGYNHS